MTALLHLLAHPAAEAYLFRRLLDYAARRGVVVTLALSALPPRRFGIALRRGEVIDGIYTSETRIIYLAPGKYADPWVLAHELGHHRLFRSHRTHTEAEADAAGRRIALALLPKWLRPVLLGEVDRHLPAGPIDSPRRRRARKGSKRR